MAVWSFDRDRGHRKADRCPLLANVMLDEVDQELERRGHRFARYADDCNAYVRSHKAGERVMRLLRRCYEKLRLTINESKSAVTSVFGRKFLGYALWQSSDGSVRRAVSAKALQTFKLRIRQLTRRNGGRSIEQVVVVLRRYLLGMESLLRAGANATHLAIVGFVDTSTPEGSTSPPVATGQDDTPRAAAPWRE